MNKPFSTNNCKITRRLLLGASGAALIGAATGRANAAGLPPVINMIVGYSPGGGTDMTARAIAPYIEKYLGGGSRIAVHNRPGAGGAIAFQAIANAAPDGGTIGFVNTPNLLTVPIERKVGFTWESFDLLGNIVDDPTNFSVHSDTPIHSIAELVAYAKKNPGAVTVGSTGIGSDDHIAMLLLARAAGIKLTHVPYAGSAAVHGAVASKSLMVAGINVGEALSYSKGGTPLRHLGQMSEERAVIAPSLPTLKEQGYNIVMASLRGMAAPKGLSPAVLAQLVGAVDQAAHDPAFKERSAKMFTPLRYLGPAAFSKELAETERGFKKLWQELPWTESNA